MNQAHPRDARTLALAALPACGIFLCFLLSVGSPRLAPQGVFPAPWELLGWAGLAALAATHQPLGIKRRAADGSLGLGAAILPAVMVRCGGVPAVLVAFLAFLLSRALIHGVNLRLSRRAIPTSTPLHLLERAMLLLGATLLSAFVAADHKLPDLIRPALAYVVVLGLSIILLSLLRGGSLPSRVVLWPLALDFIGFVGGAYFTGIAFELGWDKTVFLWLILVALVAEASRQALLRGDSDQKVGQFERLHEANERILTEAGGLGSTAQQILIECRNILPVHWFQFELPPTGGRIESWAAAPDGLLVEGRPRPPARPAMLPGIHRRADWQVLEEDLSVVAPDGNKERLATLRLWVDPRQIEPGAVERLASLLPQMASSVHRAQLDREAKTDPLTGVPVRRLLESRMQRTYRLACEEGRPMAVLMCDIDYFKKVNDTYGHAAGDQALILVARTLEKERREKDLCARYGGEEFTVLLEDSNGEDALRLAERLRRAIAALHFEYDGKHIALSVSIGIAAFPEVHIKTASELLLLADEALYEAKRRGRNQCLLHCGPGAFRAPSSDL